jgi:hypothetical protein
MNAKLRFMAALSLVVLASACGKNDNKKTAAASAPVPEVNHTQQVTPESQSAPMPDASKATTEPAPIAAFDINTIPISNKEIGEFPFFTPPEGYEYVTQGASRLNERDSIKNFSRYYYPLGKENLYPVEGKTFYNVRINSKEGGDEILLIQRNYENAITAAGGVKVFDGKVDPSKTYNILSSDDRYRYGVRNESGERQVYVIRKQDMEVWFEITCDSSCFFAVTQKGEMKQSIGTIPVSK